jgi:thiol:disulfide interchange protein
MNLYKRQRFTSPKRKFSFLLSTAAAILGIVTFASTPVFSQTRLAPPTLKIEPAHVYNNKEVTLVVQIPLSKDLHLYGPEVEKPFFKTNLIVNAQGPIIWDVSVQYPKVTDLVFMGKTISVIKPDPKTHQVTLTLKGRIRPNTSPGSYEIPATLTYQACSETTCLPPVLNKHLVTTIVVGKGVATTGVDGPPIMETVTKIPSSGYGTSFSLLNYHINLETSGIWIPLVIAFVAGILLNVMPCVLPVIPIKILQLSKQAQQEHHSPFKLSLVFGLGVILFFMSLGILAIILKSGFSWGQSFQNPNIIIGLCLVLILLALGMFDIYQVTVPKFIANRYFFQKGYLGALSMGFLAGILSTPCSFGVLGAAIAWAQMQKPFVTLVGFLTIGIGMTAPYLVLSGFPSLLNKIPHTGRWSELIKEAMGFLLLGVVAFLVCALPKDRILPTLLWFVLFSFIIWFWGVVLEFKTGRWIQIGRFVMLGLLIVTGWALLRPKSNPLVWELLTQKTYEEAKTSGKPILIEFTADWCLNCQAVEYLVFQDSVVKEFMNKKGVILLKGDLTEDNLMVSNTLKSLSGQSGIPFSVVLTPKGQKHLLPGIFRPEDLYDTLKE